MGAATDVGRKSLSADTRHKQSCVKRAILGTGGSKGTFNS